MKDLIIENARPIVIGVVAGVIGAALFRWQRNLRANKSYWEEE